MNACPLCRLVLREDSTACPRDGSAGIAVQTIPLPASLEERFSVVQPFAVGRSGTMYLADDRTTSRRGIVKLLGPPWTDAAARRHRTRRELVRQATLSERPLVVPWATGEVGDSLWLLREWLDGISLKVKLRRDGKLPVPAALSIGAQVAGGLDTLHRAGLLHRDLNPGHVILQPQAGGALPGVRLIDAAIATPVKTAQVFEVLGTPEYLSPEQGTGQLVSFRTDLYALGCLLFEMLTGEPPYGRGDVDKLMAAHVGAPVPKLPPNVPTGIATLLTSLLAKNPRERPFSAQQVRRVLEPFLPEPDDLPRDTTRAFDESAERKVRAGAPRGLGTLPPPAARSLGAYAASTGPAPAQTADAALAAVEELHTADFELSTDDHAVDADGKIGIHRTKGPTANAGSASGASAAPIEFTDDDENAATEVWDADRAATAAPKARRPSTIPPPPPSKSVPPPRPNSVPPPPPSKSVPPPRPNSVPPPPPRTSTVPPPPPSGSEAVVAAAAVEARGETAVEFDADRTEQISRSWAVRPGSDREVSRRSPWGLLAAGLVLVLMLGLVVLLRESPAPQQLTAAPEQAQAGAPAAEPGTSPETGKEVSAEPGAAESPASAAEATKPVAAADPGGESPESPAPTKADDSAAEAAPPAQPAAASARVAKPAAPATRRPKRGAKAATKPPTKAAANDSKATKPSPAKQATELRKQAKEAYMAGRFAAAAKLYQDASKLSPRDPRLMAGLGASRLRMRDANGAVDAYKAAVRLSPRTSGYHAALARAYVAAGNRTAASAAYRAALNLDPNNAAARQGLASLSN